MKYIKYCLLALVLPANLTHAFFTLPWEDHHETLTIEALTGVAYTHESTGEVLKFTEDAIEAISKQNTKTDRGWKKNASLLHFDNGAIVSSYKVLSGQKTLAKRLLGTENPWSTIESSWEFVGTALHTVQDFYSHSTWVDLDKGGIIDFYNNNVPDAQNDADDVCLMDEPYSVIPNRPTTTGHYETKDHLLPDRTERKCHHGPSIELYNPVFIDCLPSEVKGIAKDDMDCNGRTRLAGNLAKEESRAFVQTLVDELGSKGKVNGICALMGISEEDCPQDELEVVTGTLASTCTVDSEFITGQNLASLLDSDTTYFCNICNTNTEPLFSLFFDFGSSRIGFSTREQYVADVNVLDDGYEMVVERHILDDGSYFGDKTLYGSRWRVSSLARTSGDRNYLCGNLQATVQDTTIDAEALYCSTSNTPSNRGSCDL